MSEHQRRLEPLRLVRLAAPADTRQAARQSGRRQPRGRPLRLWICVVHTSTRAWLVPFHTSIYLLGQEAPNCASAITRSGNCRTRLPPLLAYFNMLVCVLLAVTMACFFWWVVS